MLRSRRAVRWERRGQKSDRGIQSKRAGRRLAMEPLEQRALLAVVMWDGGGNGSSWLESANWLNLETGADWSPTASDDVVIDDTFTSPAVPSVTLQAAPKTVASLSLDNANLHVAATTLTVSTSVEVGEGGYLQLEGWHVSSSAYREGRLTVGGDLNNAGTIVLTTSDADDSYNASATLSVSAGTLTNSGTIQIDEGPDGAGPETYMVLAALNNQGDVNVATDVGTIVQFRGGSVDYNSGNIHVASGVAIFMNFTTFDNSGTMSAGGGDIEFGVAGGSATVQNSGTLRIGSGRTADVYGNYTQTASGTLDAEVAGTTQFGKLSVTGTATLDGTLNLTCAGGYVPVEGDTFVQVVNYPAGHIGEFAEITAVNCPPSLVFTPDYDASAGKQLDLIVEATGPVQVKPDPVHGGQVTIFVTGSTGGSKVDLKSGSQPGSVQVRIDGVDLGEYGGSAIERIVVYGGDGDDDIKVHADLGPIPAELYGGPGNDKLRGGQGSDVLVGGLGDDLLSGHEGRDLLIGGDGRDKVIGQEDDDIVIGGTYVEQADRAALAAIMAEWTRTDVAYPDRVANLIAGVGPDGCYALNGSTVSDDGVKDILKGNEGLDWFLANADDDKTDQELEEILTELEYEFVTVL